MKERPAEELCDPGFYFSEEEKHCLPCEAGEGYTSHNNSLPICRKCSTCKEDQVQKIACNTTSDTVCQCKPGTFLTPEAPEFCQRCRDECPEGEVEEVSCGPWNDQKCVPKASGGTGTPGKPVTTPTEPPAGHLEIVIGVLSIGCFLAFVVIMYVSYKTCKKRTQHMFAGRLSTLKEVFSKSSPGWSETQDNDRNETLSLGPLPSVEQETGRQNPVSHANEQSPGEAQCLLERPPKKKLLVLVDGVVPTETLKLFFYYFQSVIPFKSWDKLMRQIGLCDNDILIARQQAPDDALYEMLLTWLQKTGRHASINTLLDALETLEERCARDKIEDHVVHSGKFIYADDAAEPRADGSHL